MYMSKDKNKGKSHRLVVEVDKAQFTRFRIALLQKYGMTVSNWVRLQMDKVLEEPVKGRYKTKYLR